MADIAVINALELCGVPNNMIFNGMNQRQRLAEDIFNNTFNTCQYMTIEELNEDLKTYSSLTVANGQIRLNPRIQRNLRGLVQWAKEKIMMNENPHDEAFPINDVQTYIMHIRANKAFKDKSKTLMDATAPEKLTDKTRWTDWYPSFVNYLRNIPGRMGVPLSYVIRPNDVVLKDVYDDHLDEYVDKAALEGPTFVSDAHEVHTYIVKFIAGNDTAESKLLPHNEMNNGRRDYEALREHYEGVGINAIDIVRADRTIKSLTYTGEKKPSMYWDKFEKELNYAFNTYDKREGRVVYSDNMKMRLLLEKINVDFLSQTKTSIETELEKAQCGLNYDSALKLFRNKVNAKRPDSSNNANHRRRGINAANSRHQRGGRNNRGGRGGRGGGRGYTNRNAKRKFNDARMIVCTDGTHMEVHPAYSFSNKQWNLIPESEKQRLCNERNEYNNSRSKTNTSDTRTTISEITTKTPQDNGTVSSGSSSIMGGRNEQIRTKNANKM